MGDHLMAKIPGPDDLGGLPSAYSGRQVASVDTSGLARGVANFGRGIEGAGDDVFSAGMRQKALEDRHSEEQKAADEKSQAYEWSTRLDDFKSEAERRVNEKVSTAPVDGGQITQDWEKDFKPAADAFYKQVPERLKPLFKDQIHTFYNNVTGQVESQRLKKFQTFQTDRLDTDNIKDMNKAASMPQDLAGIGVIKDRIKDRVEANPYITTEEKQKRLSTLNEVFAKNVAPAIYSDKYMNEQIVGSGRSANTIHVGSPQDAQDRGGKSFVGKAPEGKLQATMWAAKELGTTPEDLATVIMYESGGDPNRWGGAKNPDGSPRHLGLIQFGPEERAKYGVKPGMTYEEQMTKVVSFLKDRGFKPGMDLKDLYSTINAGKPGKYDASDGNGTVSTHVEAMRTGVAGRRAKEFLGSAYDPTTSPPEEDKMAKARRWTLETFGADIPPDTVERIAAGAVNEHNRIMVEHRAAIAQSEADMPVAIANTGEYTGKKYDAQDFTDAYGEQGPAKFKEYADNEKIAQQVYANKTAPTSELVAAATQPPPTTTGEGAAEDQRVYKAKADAATQILAERRADPLAYVQRTFPSVGQALENAKSPDEIKQAMSWTEAAYDRLQIPKSDRIYLPKAIADQVVKNLKTEDAPMSQRLSGIVSSVFATSDPDQSRAVFQQLVKAGVDPKLSRALNAVKRGDGGAAERMAQAALLSADKIKLSGVEADQDALLKTAVDEAFDPDNGVGGIIRMMGAGGTATTGNQILDQRNLDAAGDDRTLLTNAAKIRILNGENDPAKAVAEAAKDLYGKVKVVNQDQVKAAIPEDLDTDAVTTALFEKREAVKTALKAVDFGPGPEGTYARIRAINETMENGYWRNTGDGVGFFDPASGSFVQDRLTGEALTSPLEQVMKPQPGTISQPAPPDAGRGMIPLDQTGRVSPSNAPALDTKGIVPLQSVMPKPDDTSSANVGTAPQPLSPD